MSRKNKKPSGEPKGGWLAPPPTQGLKPVAIADGVDRKGNWRWKEVPQKKKDKELRKEWERRMAKADEKGKWQFKWPPKEN